MKKMLIKICGISDPRTAAQTAQLGADFIGIVFHPSSPRNASVQQAVEIAAAAKKAGANPVAVFVDSDAQMMSNICQTADIQFVQCHGRISRQQHHLLPAHWHRIYVRTVTQQGVLNEDAENGEIYLDKSRDYLLFDNVEMGSGKSFDRAQFHYSGDLRWFFSGGLTAQNVSEAILQLYPNGVDVSSGVESSRGQKDIRLIEEFIAAVRSI